MLEWKVPHQKIFSTIPQKTWQQRAATLSQRPSAGSEVCLSEIFIWQRRLNRKEGVFFPRLIYIETFSETPASRTLKSIRLCHRLELWIKKQKYKYCPDSRSESSRLHYSSSRPTHCTTGKMHNTSMVHCCCVNVTEQMKNIKKAEICAF